MRLNAGRIGRREWLQSMVAAPALIGLAARGQNASTWKAGTAKADITPTRVDLDGGIWCKHPAFRRRSTEDLREMRCAAIGRRRAVSVGDFGFAGFPA